MKILKAMLFATYMTGAFPSDTACITSTSEIVMMDELKKNNDRCHASNWFGSLQGDYSFVTFVIIFS